MSCELRLRPQQTVEQRKREVRKAVSYLERALAMQTIKAKVGPTGGITFVGWNANREGVSDACAYRIIMTSGEALAKMAIAVAEQMAGRTVSKAAVDGGVHSHDGGKSWGTD